jgi:hypothetical protein
VSYIINCARPSCYDRTFCFRNAHKFVPSPPFIVVSHHTQAGTGRSVGIKRQYDISSYKAAYVFLYSRQKHIKGLILVYYGSLLGAVMIH